MLRISNSARQNFPLWEQTWPLPQGSREMKKSYKSFLPSFSYFISNLIIESQNGSYKLIINRLEKVEMNEEYHEYVIVGAGISGLQAALVLAQNKKDFIILEASDKIGGRIATQKIKHALSQYKQNGGNSQTVQWIQSDEQILQTSYEVGATWVSKEHTYLLKKLREYELQTYSQYFDGLNIYGIAQGKYEHVESLSDYFKVWKKQLNYVIDKIENLKSNLQQILQAQDNRPPQTLRKRLSQKSIGDDSPTRKSEKEIKESQLIEQYIDFYDNISVYDYMKKEIKNEFLSDMILNEIQTLQCISCKKISMLQLIDENGGLELLRLYCDKVQNTIDGMKIKNGMISIVKQTLSDILNTLDQYREVKQSQILKLNSPVTKIDNSIGQDVKIYVKSNPQTVYTCNRVLFSVPIAVANKIQFTKISPSKQLIFDNQELGNVRRVYMVFPSAFWRGKYSGYGSFGSKFPFNEITDLSPANLSCGILAFVFIGQYYKKWASEMRDSKDREMYLKKIIADIFLKGHTQEPVLQKAFIFSRSFSENQFIRAAYQATTKPHIWKTIKQNGDDYLESYSRDEYNVFYIGSEFADEHSTYIEGALRGARSKTYKLLQKKDPWQKLL